MPFRGSGGEAGKTLGELADVRIGDVVKDAYAAAPNAGDIEPDELRGLLAESENGEGTESPELGPALLDFAKRYRDAAGQAEGAQPAEEALAA